MANWQQSGSEGFSPTSNIFVTGASTGNLAVTGRWLWCSTRLCFWLGGCDGWFRDAVSGAPSSSFLQ
eukprot:2815556-Amphidinium_carterae.1